MKYLSTKLFDSLQTAITASTENRKQTQEQSQEQQRNLINLQHDLSQVRTNLEQIILTKQAWSIKDLLHGKKHYFLSGLSRQSIVMAMMTMTTMSNDIDYFLKPCDATKLIAFCFFFFQANVVLKEKETFIEYLQKQLNETKTKLDSEVSIASTCMSTLLEYLGVSQIY